MQPPVAPDGRSGEVLAEVRADASTYGKGVAARAVVMLPIILVGVFGTRRSTIDPWVMWLIIGLGVVVAVVAVLAMITRVQVTRTGLRVRRLSGVEREIPAERIVGGVLAEHYEIFGSPLSPMLTVMGANGRLVRLSGQVFRADTLRRLVVALGPGRFSMIEEPITPKMVHQRFPGVVPFWERRPWLMSVLFVLAIIVVVVLFHLDEFGR